MSPAKATAPTISAKRFTLPAPVAAQDFEAFPLGGQAGTSAVCRDYQKGNGQRDICHQIQTALSGCVYNHIPYEFKREDPEARGAGPTQGRAIVVMQRTIAKSLDSNCAWIYTFCRCCNAAIVKEDAMKQNTKSEQPEAPARAATPVAMFSEWIQQGTENYFAAQRILLDLVMQQNAMAMNTLRERFAVERPVAAASEFAGEGVSNFIAAQKILLNLAERQNEIVMKGVKERVGVASPPR